MSSSAAAGLLSDAFKQRLQVETKGRSQKVAALRALYDRKVNDGKESAQKVFDSIVHAAEQDPNVEPFFMQTWADCDSCRPDPFIGKLEGGSEKPDWLDGEINPV